MIYEILTRPFYRATPVQRLSAIIQDEPVALEGLDSRVPPPLRWVIERCLAKDPAERYGTAGELGRDLRQVRDKLSDFQESRDRGSRRVDVQLRFRQWRRRWRCPRSRPGPPLIFGVRPLDFAVSYGIQFLFRDRSPSDRLVRSVV